ncbi:hypothetical protein ENUP19_0083G0006 [Entamoeba nuttalli]|uniref:UDP-N-acetylglucosamine transferase subunit ALG14 n=2 Tax=Entamoeba nuttalli TaxID=412467 RepID=K2HHY2_ENTNP|nr:glycosyltransferase family 28 C-terminal domain containing protein [Entamoeba nuttalli P19]EKE42584.1 glycosyltransferase family 28 C-terminal domain containing protein [Entamoeba nuttalli P19]|eukprot:XP_008855077.1 glycosyltransferase family 28 C-terminal domain containing protein [Entamoeba nuttalli P19]
MKLFVTVGTTEFERLIETINEEDVMKQLSQIGVTEMVVQYGHGKYIPESKAGITVHSFSMKTSISEDFKAADLIITHAGAGSVNEALSVKKPTIVVINDALMNNHQTEIAKKLSELGAVTYCPSPSILKELLSHYTVQPGKDIVLKGKEVDEKIGYLMKEWCGLDKNKDKEICVVLGSGGHTMEMLHVLHPLDELCHDVIKQFDVIVAESDNISSKKLEGIKSKYNVHQIPRSRKVGQSYFTSIFTTLYAIFVCIGMVLKIRPEVLLCNGPGTCVPVCICCWFLNLFQRKKTRIVYLESVCRVTTLSLTGKILKFIADIFVIQWEELKPLNRNAIVHHLFYASDN